VKALVVGIAALVVTAAAVPLCIAAARRWDVLDRPGPLKSQRGPVPYLGGVAVFCGAVVGALASRPIVLAPITMALALGVADDKFALPARYRLAGQLAIGLVVALVVPLHIRGGIGVPLLLVASVVLINGFNMLDGLDMLAGGVGAVAAAGFAILLLNSGRVLAVALAGSLLAFLWYNRPPARIYLGDGGSYLIGTTSAVLLAYAWGAGVTTATGVVSLAVLAVPVAEVACAVVRRWRGHGSLLAGDRRHPYDLLVANGWSALAASGAYVAAQGVIVIIVASVDHASMTAALVVDACVAAAVLGAAALVGGLSRPAEARQ
jgi:UDP-GlcNAc:undecaprenyl-phosphate/decaprenyl-phosphate GlcNAc-1-phosphate transferase